MVFFLLKSQIFFLFRHNFDCPGSRSVFPTRIRIRIPNTDPDPGEPFQYGSTWIQIRIRNTGLCPLTYGYLVFIVIRPRILLNSCWICIMRPFADSLTLLIPLLLAGSRYCWSIAESVDLTKYRLMNFFDWLRAGRRDCWSDAEAPGGEMPQHQPCHSRARCSSGLGLSSKNCFSLDNLWQ